jgi:tetratricopeptide (TPR) repeat protein
MRFHRGALPFLLYWTLAVLPLYLPAQSSSPQEPDSLKQADAAFHAGYAALQAGKLEQARAQFAEAARLAPQIPEGHEALGEVLIELGKPAEAVPELEAALHLKPGDQGLESNLALAYAKSGDPARAVGQFSTAYQASQQPGGSPVDAGFCQAYARALAAVGKLDEAVQMFQAAVDRGAATADILDAIGSLYAQSGNWMQAKPQFEHALSIDGSYVPARIHLGIVQRQQNDLDAALASMLTAVTANPGNALAQSEYGRTLEAAGKDEAATPYLEQAIKLNPDLPGARNELAMALQRQGRQQEAIPWFQQAIQREPRNVSALTNLGLALTLTGKAKDGLTYFQQAMTIAAPDATLYKDQGVAHVQLSAFDEAIADFQAALALDPSDPQLHYDLGMAYKLKDRVSDAIAELTRAGEMDPTLQDPPYTLGILYMQIGKLDDAVVELKKSVALRPENGDAWAILGSTLKQDSRLDEARDALEKALPLLPGQPGPRVTLAAVLAEQAGAGTAAADAAESAGDQQKAEQLRAQVKQLRAQAAELRRQGADLARSAVNRQKATFALNAGNQLLLKGQIADAVARYQEAIAADPTYAEPHNQLAIAFDRQGRADDAAAERAKAASLGPAK